MLTQPRMAGAGFPVLASGAGGAGTGPVAFAVQSHADAGQVVNNSNVKTESLGTKTIEGIPVTGTRTTNTIPAGTIGNDRDLLLTRETWYSSDLKLVLESRQFDPRFGETTYSLTNLQRSEPDPSLFQIPAGYKTEQIALAVQTN